MAPASAATKGTCQAMSLTISLLPGYFIAPFVVTRLCYALFTLSWLMPFLLYPGYVFVLVTLSQLCHCPYHHTLAMSLFLLSYFGYVIVPLILYPGLRITLLSYPGYANALPITLWLYHCPYHHILAMSLSLLLHSGYVIAILSKSWLCHRPSYVAIIVASVVAHNLCC